ncbi:phosphoribosylformylglycinamidine synthase subunit PurQ [Caminibacter mediatlanticus TB-2]|uniref:Phosphoribosylformylglycinamidine synthase subunit PurQ n=1 Tax=Caminibacter mediatlanticus TB-2 TaxID=391592 RepID=A0AAI9AET5_9BACT|nr:phosphoribosylformylglycinamidine synthase subunit PurQ [Caminibacter mediatlanticus]EDM22841.1 phosphoribosylformylglycinamidine synthase subunit I [Caminibacter mediatlanticus TB-2]QCT94508.1 phosphoribosylformylglycinamidine synthase subunit PurQ [Caminibacter mediatlanticus TB-2]
MKVGIIVFPGTNCDRDTKWAFEKLGAKSEFIWHNHTNLDNFDLIVLPGGFSYGDYLRSGAIARFSPIMNEVIKFANKGGYVLGICNGFQILLESHLLPGGMTRNESLHFISKFHHLKVVNNNNKFLSNLNVGEIVNIPIAHAEGNYKVDSDTLKEMYDNEQVLLKYCDKNGNEFNPNGSVDSIAGICNKNKNVFGLMPHPERAMSSILGGEDGIKMLKGFFK